MEASFPVDPPRSTIERVARVWPAVLFVGLYWGVQLALRVIDPPIGLRFFSLLGSLGGLFLGFSLWWLIDPSRPWRRRWSWYVATALFGVIACVIADRRAGTIGLLISAIPWLFTFWGASLLLTRRAAPAKQRFVWLAAMVVACALIASLRIDGIDGSGRATISWRWTPTAEARYLAARSTAATPSATPSTLSARVTPQPGDWLEFRGPQRHSEVRGVTIATDWQTNPPKQVWRQPVGPAWSSMLIVDGRLYTQEQRGEKEAVVCLDAATGREIWAHEDNSRHSDGQAGAGPRATPTFYQGRLYTLGAKGVLDCLDATRGTVVWTRDVIDDSGADVPIWGFSSSPLLIDHAAIPNAALSSDLVVIYAGGPDDQGMLAYDAATGAPVWNAPTGRISYSSPQSMQLEGEEQILIFTDQGLTSVAIATGKKLWQFDADSRGMWRAIQPRGALADAATDIDDGGNGILIGSEDLGLVRLEVTRSGGEWTVKQSWASKELKPTFNDLVLYGNHVYGFDGSIFGCADLKSGKRLWKRGRYGNGQVLLLVDQGLLLVLTETGEVVLVSARPDKHEELARFEAIKGKTWNHPVVAHGRLYVRNDEEMACYDLRIASPTTAVLPTDNRLPTTGAR